MIEHLRPGVSAANARVALVDFDGTISVIRSGWMEIMIPMMVEILMDLKTGEREDDLRAIVEEFVGRLTGKQTMYQMIALAEEIEKRGGTPLDPLEYKNQYLALLNDRIRDALSELREERCPPEKYLVPGARALLESLHRRGLHHSQLSLPRRAAGYSVPRMSAVKSKYPLFDRGRLLEKPLAERSHDLHIEHWLSLEDSAPEYAHPQLDEVARRIVAAGRSGAARILMMGAHVL